MKAKKTKVKRKVTTVQHGVSMVRAQREALVTGLIEGRGRRTSPRSARSEEMTVSSSDVQPLLRGEREPDVIVMEDGSVRLAPMTMMIELGDGDHE